MGVQPDVSTPVNAPITRVWATAYRVPTEEPEADGTLAWDATAMVAVHAEAGGRRGFGYTYADAAAARLINDTLAPVAEGMDALAPQAVWHAARARLRNSGQAGLGACALSALDTALWDLKARLLDVPMVRLLGKVRDSVRAYASGGFTSYGEARLVEQLGDWAAGGFAAVKIKIGGRGRLDLDHVELARDTIGREVDLFVDANGAYTVRQATGYATRLADHGVTWFEEPVTSDDIDGLRMVRERAPGGMAVAAGEYAWSSLDMRRLLEARAVDVVQPDITRCGGVTGFLDIAGLCGAFHTPLSTHTAPSLHVHVACAAQPTVHAEYFHDHVRLEGMLLDGAAQARDGRLRPDATAPGWGLVLKEADARAYEV